MLNTTLLETTSAGRERAYPIGATLRALTPDGVGTIRYFVNDGYAGVELDTEPGRVDEWPLGRLEVAS